MPLTTQTIRTKCTNELDSRAARVCVLLCFIELRVGGMGRGLLIKGLIWGFSPIYTLSPQLHSWFYQHPLFLF